MENKELWMHECELTWWDDIENLPIEKKVKCIVAGYSFADVTEKIERWYGDSIENLFIKILDNTDGGVYEVSNVAVDR